MLSHSIAFQKSHYKPTFSQSIVYLTDQTRFICSKRQDESCMAPLSHLMGLFTRLCQEQKPNLKQFYNGLGCLQLLFYELEQRVSVVEKVELHLLTLSLLVATSQLSIFKCKSLKETEAIINLFIKCLKEETEERVEEKVELWDTWKISFCCLTLVQQAPDLDDDKNSLFLKQLTLVSLFFFVFYSIFYIFFNQLHRYMRIYYMFF
jgi:hypothetical protein